MISHYISFILLFLIFFIRYSISQINPYFCDPYFEINCHRKYYVDRTLHYFDISEFIEFTSREILNISEHNYIIKLKSVLTLAKDQELDELSAQKNKGYNDTIKLLDDIPNSSNITIYEYGINVSLLWYQSFYIQGLYFDNNICNYKYSNDIHMNGTNLQIYNPDTWLKRINYLDKIYSLEILPAHFEHFLKKKMEQLKQKTNESEISLNIKLLQFYQYLAQIERQRFVMIATIHQVKFACGESNDTSILYGLQKSLIRRTQSYIRTVKKYMKFVSREIYLNNLDEYKMSEMINIDEHHRVSLKAAISDTNQNEVITAVALECEKNIIYPHIQTSILSSNGYIRSKRPEFKNHWEKGYNDTLQNNSVSNVDYVHFGSNLSQVQCINLDDIYLDEGYVVTGIKFSMISNDEINDTVSCYKGIGLEIRATEFNFETGQLGKSKWISGKIPMAQRTELTTKNLNIRKLNGNIPQSEHYIKFQTLKSINDSETTIIPYFDGRHRTNYYSFPLSGIGIYYESLPDSKGYISFKLISYDPSTYLNEII